MTAKVAVEKTSYSFDRLFDYRIPYSLQERYNRESGCWCRLAAETVCVRVW